MFTRWKSSLGQNLEFKNGSSGVFCLFTRLFPIYFQLLNSSTHFLNETRYTNLHEIKKYIYENFDIL